jgi:hypothetical protein
MAPSVTTVVSSEMCSSYSSYEKRRALDIYSNPLSAERATCESSQDKEATGGDSSFSQITPPSTPPPPRPAYSTPIDETGMTVTQLLSLSIKKRRVLVKHHANMDMRRELHVSNVVSRLCEFIGEVRAARRRHAVETSAKMNHQTDIVENVYDDCKSDVPVKRLRLTDDDADGEQKTIDTQAVSTCSDDNAQDVVTLKNPTADKYCPAVTITVPSLYSRKRPHQLHRRRHPRHHPHSHVMPVGIAL